MPSIHPPEYNLHLPTPKPGEVWEPWTVHTHFYSFSAADGEIGGYLYLRWQPASMTSQGGVCIWKGADALEMIDMAHHDYRVTLGWPEVSENGRRFTMEQGYSIEYAEDLLSARLTYQAADGNASFDLVATGATPLVARGHAAPSEYEDAPQMTGSGGLDQICHVVGGLELNGEHYDVDCHAYRDRSWGQLRAEGMYDTPPWSNLSQYYGPDLALNAFCIEHPDTDPSWKGIYEWPEGRSTVVHGWGVVHGELVDVTDIRRDASDFHPYFTCPQHQEVDVTFSGGKTLHFVGDMVSMSTVFTWVNTIVRAGVYRWRAPDGRTTYDAYMEQYHDGKYAREMRRRLGVIVDAPSAPKAGHPS
jgi:hypothetical protein